MSRASGPTPRAQPAGRRFNPPRVVPLRPPAAPAAPAEPDRSAAGPSLAEAPGFATTSLELAAYLVLTGHRIAQITGPRTHRRVHFGAVSEEDRLAFYNGAAASARQLFETWHSLRHGLMNLLD